MPSRHGWSIRLDDRSFGHDYARLDFGMTSSKQLPSVERGGPAHGETWHTCATLGTRWLNVVDAWVVWAPRARETCNGLQTMFLCHPGERRWFLWTVCRGSTGSSSWMTSYRIFRLSDADERYNVSCTYEPRVCSSLFATLWIGCLRA